MSAGVPAATSGSASAACAVRRLADELGRIAPAGTRVFVVGGATAVLAGRRASTVDVDLRIEPSLTRC